MDKNKTEHNHSLEMLIENIIENLNIYSMHIKNGIEQPDHMKLCPCLEQARSDGKKALDIVKKNKGQEKGLMQVTKNYTNLVADYERVKEHLGLTQSELKTVYEDHYSDHKTIEALKAENKELKAWKKFWKAKTTEYDKEAKQLKQDKAELLEGLENASRCIPLDHFHRNDYHATKFLIKKYSE